MSLFATLIAGCAILGVIAFVQVQGLRRQVAELSSRLDEARDEESDL